MQTISRLNVLELCGCVSSAFCTRLFAGFGADVLVVPRDGAPAFTPEEHAWFHTGKRVAPAFDGTAADAQARLAALFDHADVVVDSWGVGVLERLGLDTATVAQRWPDLVLCQITPFGQYGPYRDFQADDITLYAMAGLMNSTGDGAREPLNAQPKVARLTAGLNAYVGCFMALLRRERDGGGDVLDVSIQESAIENYETAMSDFLHLGKIARRNDDNHNLVPWRTYRVKDGWACVIGGPIRNWLKAAPLFEAPELLREPLDAIGGRIEHRKEFEALLKPWLMSHTREEVFHTGQSKGLAWGYVASLTEALALPQLQARGYFIEREDETLGRYRMPGAPYRGPSCHWRDRPAAVVPQASWNAQKPQPARPKVAAGKAKAPPLAGVKIVDFTHDWAGPHTTRLLADFGAEVVKIEYHKRLDSCRGGRKAMIDEHPRFWNLHRGKSSVTLDLALPEHRLVCEKLVAECDVLIENSRPDVMARKGLPWSRVRELNPKIIQVSMSGYGASGPISHYGGYGASLEGLSGFQSMTAYSDDGARYRVREMDVLNSIMPAGAICAALWHRRLSGEGQYIDFSELEGCSWYIGEHFVRASREGRDRPVLANRHERYAPQGCYAAGGADRWIVITARDDAEWQRLAKLIGGKALEPRFATVEQRRAAHAELDTLIGAWTRDRDASQLMYELQSHGIPAGVALNPADLAKDAHLAVRKWFLETPQGRFPGLPFVFRDGGAVWRHRGPKLGENNAAIFAAAGLPGAAPDLSPERIGTAYEKE